LRIVLSNSLFLDGFHLRQNTLEKDLSRAVERPEQDAEQDQAVNDN